MGTAYRKRRAYALIDHVEDVAALLDFLKVKHAAIAGLSVGGMIAQSLAARRPDLVSALILADTAHRIGTVAAWNQRIETVTEEGISAIANGVLKMWFTPNSCTSSNPDFAGYYAMLTRTSIEGYLGTCAALRDADLTETARALTLPVLCLVGNQDGSTPPALVRSMADLIRGAEFCILSQAGHLPNVEQPQSVADLISSFIQKSRGSGSNAT